MHGKTGKTSLRNRYFKGAKGFSQAYIATIGADFVTKTLELQDGTRVSVQLWDTGGASLALGSTLTRQRLTALLFFFLSVIHSRPGALSGQCVSATTPMTLQLTARILHAARP